ncbi:hypothetical protein AB205_0021840, partial [Aquarana catesbeiana]
MPLAVPPVFSGRHTGPRKQQGPVGTRMRSREPGGEAHKASLPDSLTEDGGSSTRGPRDRSASGADIAGALDRWRQQHPGTEGQIGFGCRHRRRPG